MFKTLRSQMKLIFIIVAIFFAFSIYLGYGAYLRGRRTGGAPTTAAIVNGVPISKAALNSTLRRELSRYKPEDLRNMKKEEFEKIRRSVLQGLINYELLYQEALKEGLKPSSKEIDDAIKSFEKKFPSKEEFLRFLRRQGVTVSDLKRGLEKDLAVRKLLSKIQENVKVNEKEIRNLYEKYKKAFVEPKKYEIAYLELKDSKKAEEIYKELQSGKKWSDIAPKSKPEKKSLRELPKQFSKEEKEFKAKSPFIIKDDKEKKYWVGYVFSIIPPKQRSYEDVKKQLEQILRYTEGAEAQRKFILALRAKAEIKYIDPSLAPPPPAPKEKKAAKEEAKPKQKESNKGKRVKEAESKKATESKSK
ncbi:MAG: SurA N-terminal domain-containing protein [Synergistetes bacterium]|nr:SurA N-terminal domain-containing protein [Synergistota bacterium]